MNQFIKNCLESIAKNSALISTASQSINTAIVAILGFSCGQEDAEIFEDSLSDNANTGVTNTLNKNNNDSYTKVQGERSLKTILKEIKELIIELKIKGSVRERSNGLIELRTQAFGSIYGRSKEEIEQKLTIKLKEVSKGPVRKEKKQAPLLSEFYYGSYLPYKKNQNRAESTIKDIEYKFNYIMRCGFDKRLNDYKSADIEKFLYSIEQTRKRQMMQGLFNNMFTRAVALSLIKNNPCTPIDKMEHQKKTGTAFSFDEQRKFFCSLFANDRVTYRQKMYFAFVYLTGARRNEALAVKYKDADFKNKVLSIHGTKTEGSERQIPLTPLVEKIFSSIGNTKDFLFDLTETQADKLMRETVKSLGIKHKLHDLRHTFGTIQICVERIDVKTVSLWMGHSTMDTTLRIYTHPEQLDKGTFLRGDMQEEDKNAAYRNNYTKILQIIEDFI